MSEHSYVKNFVSLQRIGLFTVEQSAFVLWVAPKIIQQLIYDIVNTQLIPNTCNVKQDQYWYQWNGVWTLSD